MQTDELYQAAKMLDKEIYFPRVIGDKMEFYLVDDGMDFELSSFGVREPKVEVDNLFVPQEADDILVLMPGVVFDEDGNRIGYGGGYYDKYLQWLKKKVKLENPRSLSLVY